MPLTIHLLGQFSVFAGDQPVDIPSRPAQSLLAYLALTAGITHRREKLAGVLWPDTTEANARAYLRQALWRIRKALESAHLAGDAYLQITDVAVTFDARSDYWLDTEVLQAPVENRSVDDVAAMLKQVKGELLPGFYDEWVIPQRERLDSVYAQRMAVLLDSLLAARRWHEAIEWSERWIQLAPAPEPAFRALMKAHAGLGNAAMVSATYQRCLAALDRELSLDPSPETRHLYEQLQRGDTEWLTGHAARPTQPAARPAFLDSEVTSDGPPSIFVARQKELDRLATFVDLAVRGQGRAVFVTGEAGSGKTALLNELVRHAQQQHPTAFIVTGSCNAQTGIGDPYLPFREVLEMLTGDVEGRWAAGTITTAHARQLWRSLAVPARALVESGPDLINAFVAGPALRERVLAGSVAEPVWLPRLTTLVQRETDASWAMKMRQSDLFEQYSRVLGVVARHAPILLIIDDLQWADLGSISLLFHLGRHLAGQRILIAGAYRPEEVALGRDGERHPLESVLHELQRLFGNISVDLDATEGRDFVEAILDSEPNALGPSFRYMIYQQTRGNPLFTIELLRGLQDRGDLATNTRGEWVEGPSLDWETIPARVEAVIAERIARLARPLQTALQVASVEGEVFTAEVVAQVQGIDTHALLASLGGDLDRRHQLVQAQSIVRHQGRLLSRYRFRHILFQKYLYNQLNEVERVHLHEQIGTALEDLYRAPEGPAPAALQLARHFEEAGITGKAIQYLGEAGKKALFVSAYQEAIAHLSRGLALLNTMPGSAKRDRQELELQVLMAIALQNTLGAQSSEVRATCKRALELYDQAEDVVQLFRILGSLATHHFVRAEHELACVYGRQALRVAEEAADPLLIGMANWYQGFVSFYRGQYVVARRYLAAMLAIYDPAQHRERLLSIRGSDAGLSAMAYDACSLWVLGYPDRAHELSRRALAMAREFDHDFTSADVICYGGCLLHELRRDAASSLRASEEFFQLLDRGGPSSWLDAAVYYHGVALILNDRPQEGIAQLQMYLTGGKTRSVLIERPGAYRALAGAYGMLGQMDKALAALDQGFALMNETGAFLWEAEMHRTRAELLLKQGQIAGAESSLLAALETARHQGARSFELRAALDLARLWQQQGRAAEARDTLAPIYAWFAEGFNEPDLLAAKALLATLAK